MRSILMSCIHHWESPFRVASHYLALDFLKRGWKVFYLSAPVSPLHLLKGKRDQLGIRWASWKAGGKNDHEGRLWAYVPFSLICPDNRPLLRSKTVLRNWVHTTLPNLKAMLRQMGISSPDLLYLDNAYHAPLLDLVEPAGAIYHLADDYSAFPGSGPGLTEVEKDLARKVDLILYPSRHLKAHVDRLAPRQSMFLSNGIDLARFTDGTCALPDDYASNGPKAVYVGATETWLDNHVIATAAEANPDVDFYLIGPKPAPSRRVGRANVHYLGEKSADDVPGYLKHADVGIIPFDIKGHSRLIAPVRPLKLFEYMASGLPVVSTRWAELEAMGSPALLSGTPDAFGLDIAKAIADKDALGKAGLAYVQQYDWEKLLSPLHRWVDQMGI